MKVLLTGGGTAGHINPAIAIGELFERNAGGCDILFSGTPHGMERELVSKKGYPYYPIEVCGLSRSLSVKNLRALYLAAVSPQRAKRMLKELSPDLVVGTGGYVSWPMLSAAAALGIPTALHESNAIPGLTVRRLSSKVDLVLLNFAEAAERLPKAKQILHVGNPLRGGFNSIPRSVARAHLGIPEKAKLVVSFGGSLGAEGINRAVLSLWESYAVKRELHFHIHAAGRRYYDDFCRQVAFRFPCLPSRLQYKAYLEEMPLLMSACDLLICRAGAMTLSEAARAGRAAVLIPSPYVAGDHQTKNAEALAALGAAVLLPEKDLTPSSITAAVSEILESPQGQEKMEQAIAAFDIPDANRRIYNALSTLAHKKKRPTLG